MTSIYARAAENTQEIIDKIKEMEEAADYLRQTGRSTADVVNRIARYKTQAAKDITALESKGYKFDYKGVQF